MFCSNKITISALSCWHPSLPNLVLLRQSSVFFYRRLFWRSSLAHRVARLTVLVGLGSHCLMATYLAPNFQLPVRQPVLALSLLPSLTCRKIINLKTRISNTMQTSYSGGVEELGLGLVWGPAVAETEIPRVMSW